MPVDKPSENNDLIGAKARMRQAMLARRRAQPAAGREAASEQLCWSLGEWIRRIWLPEHSGVRIGVYLASTQEANLDAVIETLLHQKIPVAAPRVDLPRHEITFWLLRSLQEVETGAYGLREPPMREKVPVPPLLLVPGVAFDSHGGRLGMGGGWYDRLLGGESRSIGVAFDWQVVPEVPREAHDRVVDAVVTPRGWFAGGTACDTGPARPGSSPE